MADPFPIDASAGAPSYAAQEVRLALVNALAAGGSNAIGARSGVRPTGSDSELWVTAQTTPDMTVKVNTGVAVVMGAVTTTQGPYTYCLDTVTNLAIAAAHATLSRIDRVCVRVRDGAVDTSGQRDGAVMVITGIPASSPSAPGDPDNSAYMTLAEVTVAPAVTSITNAAISDKRPYMAGPGGILRCKSTARPASPAKGQAIFETDTGKSYIYDGTVYKQILHDLYGKGRIYSKKRTAGNLVTGISTEFTIFTKSGIVVEPNRVYCIAALVPTYNESVGATFGSSHARLRIKDTTSGTTIIGQSAFEYMNVQGSSRYVVCQVDYVTGGAQSSLSLALTMERGLGSGLLTVFGNADMPLMLLVTDVSGNTAIVEA